jgi:hypothetical protein
VPTGEIDGTVYLRTGDSEKVVSNTQVQLVKARDFIKQKMLRRLGNNLEKVYVNNKGKLTKKINMPFYGKHTFFNYPFGKSRRKGKLAPRFQSPIQNVSFEGGDEVEVVQEVKSEFDGCYLFQFVPPGRYWVRIAPKQVERLNLKTPAPQKIVIEGSEAVISGVDFLLEQAERVEAKGKRVNAESL